MYRRRGAQLEVLIVHPGGPFWKNKDAGAWSIPKGEFLPGEDPLKTAKREFKEELGTTPAAFVENARLGEAQRRLGESRRRASIDAVARSVGYASSDVFRRAFERRFGVSPSNYRSRYGSGASA